METNILKTAAATIRMPEDMKQRIINNCTEQILITKEKTIMKNHKNFGRNPAAVFAALAICLSLAVTAVAAPGILKGQFRDIKDWRGAVVGTSYEQATDEIAVSVTVKGDALTVHTVIADPQMAPYAYAQRLGIAQYRIESENGKTLQKGTAESVEIVNGTADVVIPLDCLESGSYNLIVTAFFAESKGDQPLNINGHWECGFIK